MIRLIASDMDGTLLNGEGRLEEEFFEVFDKLMKKDIKFAIASGRQYRQLISNFESISDRLIYIAENGTIVKYKDEEIYSSPINNEDVIGIVEFAEDIKGISLVLCGKDCAYINTDNEELLSEMKKYYFNYEVVDDFRNIDKEILKIGVLDLKGSETNSYKIFYPAWKDKLQIVVSGKIWLDIYNKESNKGLAIKLIQDKFNISREETMAFGDYYNDVDMLKMAHYSYAMDNAPDGVKKHANFIAKSNREKGVIEAIKEVVLKVI